jgi:coenzyme Q-binding protein COQ10
MPAHTDEKHFNYTTTQLYELVSDVERYPEFLPWVKAVRVTQRHQDYFVADVVVHFKAITEKYTCRVDVEPPNDESEAGTIDVSLISGPFHHLANNWRFEPGDDGTGCEVQFHVDFAFKTPFLDKIIGALFDRATRKMISAFESRAEQLYGKV